MGVCRVTKIPLFHFKAIFSSKLSFLLLFCLHLSDKSCSDHSHYEGKFTALYLYGEKIFAQVSLNVVLSVLKMETLIFFSFSP